MLHLSAPLYERLGFTAQTSDEHVTAYHRNIILDINCRLGNDHCINRAQELLEQFRNNPCKYYLSPFCVNCLYLFNDFAYIFTYVSIISNERKLAYIYISVENDETQTEYTLWHSKYRDFIYMTIKINIDI